MDGLINLYKPAGPTSHDMVEQVRRLLHMRRVGHGGTLDPLAEGVLPIGVGMATRLLPFLQEAEKAYRAEVVLGISTTTYDAEGAISAERPVPPFERTDIVRVLETFRGEIEQTPPTFSAVRRDGQRSYRRARHGDMAAPLPRRVRIVRLDLLSWLPPAMTLEIVCGSGTYVRSLAHDLGERLGCGGHVRHLVRLRVGPLALEEAIGPDGLAAAVAAGRLDEVLLPLDLPVREWPAVYLDERQAADVLNGKFIFLPAGPSEERARGYGPDGRLLALLKRRPGAEHWHPSHVFASRKDGGP